MHIFYDLQFVSLCSSTRQGLKLFTFAIFLSISTPAWPLYILEWSNWWPLCNLFSVNLYFSSCICSYLSNDRTLYVAMFV